MNTMGNDVVLTAGLSPEELDERLRRASRYCDVGHRALAFYLADMQARGAHQALGMPSAIAYATRALGMSRRSAREHVAVGAKLEELEAIDAAFAEGIISWSRVRRIAPIASRETEQEWLDCARGCSQDELDARVRRARPGDAPGSNGLPTQRFALRIELDALQYEMWQNARAKLRAESGHEEELTDDVVLQEMLELMLRSDADGSVPGRKPVDGSAFQVVVSNGAEEGASVATDGANEPIDDAAFERASSDAVTPPRLRRRVFDRDRHRCANCRSRRSLHAHHIVWRSRGGATSMDNLVTLCSTCHGLVHGGWLDVERCAAGGPGAAGRFVFRDAHERIVERRVLVGPRLTLDPAARVAQCAGSEEIPDRVDRHWYLANADRIASRGGKLVLTQRT